MGRFVSGARCGEPLDLAIPQLGFVRVSVQRTGGAVGLHDTAEVLQGMLETLGERHLFIPDDQTATTDWPAWCQTAARSTGADLITLAEAHRMRLATFDESIPGAFVIP